MQSNAIPTERTRAISFVQLAIGINMVKPGDGAQAYPEQRQRPSSLNMPCSCNSVWARTCDCKSPKPVRVARRRPLPSRSSSENRNLWAIYLLEHICSTDTNGCPYTIVDAGGLFTKALFPITYGANVLRAGTVRTATSCSSPSPKPRRPDTTSH